MTLFTSRSKLLTDFAVKPLLPLGRGSAGERPQRLAMLQVRSTGSVKQSGHLFSFLGEFIKMLYSLIGLF